MHPKTNNSVNTDAQYFVVQQAKGLTETKGQPTATFGHQLPHVSGSTSDGIFASWCWDGTRLVVTNDRYGLYPLFWYRTPCGGVGISNSLLQLVKLGASTDLDFEALAVFLRLGTFVGNDTPFNAIQAMPPNVIFKWENGEVECHSRKPKTPRAVILSRNDAIDQYLALFANAMAKRRPPSGQTAVPISGGRDSRHILLELHRTGREPDVCVSALDNPPDPNQDPEIGALLCRELGFRHVTVGQKLSLLKAEQRKNRETHFCAPAHGWYLALADFLNEGFSHVHDGLGGDVLSQSSFLTPELNTVFRSGDTQAIVDRLLFGDTAELSVLEGLLDHKLQKQINPQVARKRLTKEVERHLGAPNPVASFFFWNRTRRMTALAPYSLLATNLHAYTPFLDHDLFDFTSALPSEMLLDRTFHDDAIARAYPTFSHIPYANHKAAKPADDSRIKARFYNEAARQFMMRKPWALMNNMVPRAKLLVGTLSQGRIRPWIPLWFIYLDQIESLVANKPRLNNRQ